MFPKNANPEQWYKSRQGLRSNALTFGKPITVQDIEYIVSCRIILALAELGEVRLEALLDFGGGLVHGFADICYFVRKLLVVNSGLSGRTEGLVFPDISLHANSVESVLAEEGQPRLYGLWVSILNLDQATESNSFEVLLALLVHEVASRDGPAFDDAREGHGTGDGEVKVVGGADGEVGEEFHVLNAVGS